MRWVEAARRSLRHHLPRMMVRIRAYVPPGFRWLAGLLLMAGGVLGFLPVLGFWMIPLGIAVFLLDIKSLRHWWTNRHNR